MERRLISDYEELISDLLPALTKDNLAAAVALASLPDQIRGYGPVKARSVEEATKRREELLAAFHAEPTRQAA